MDNFFITDRGQKRLINEDAGGVFFNESEQVLAIVADGMGGHQAGEVASQLAVSIAHEKWKYTEKITTAKAAEQWMVESFDDINQQIYENSQNNTAFSGMGTTIVLAICLADTIIVGHVGDSRAYLNLDNHLQQVTADHSLVNELLKAGEITKQDAENHPRKNVLIRAVGTDEHVTVDITSKEWRENDALLLCSDGLYNKVTDEELSKNFKSTRSFETITKELVHLANERGGEDNITLVIVHNRVGSKAGDASC